MDFVTQTTNFENDQNYTIKLWVFRERWGDKIGHRYSSW